MTTAAASPAPRSVRILGIRIDDVTFDETLTRLGAMAKSGTPHHVMTVNPEFIMIAQRNSEFRSVLEAATLCLADGIGVVAAARLQRTPIAARITGSDTIPALARIAARENFSLFLLGAAPGIAERTAEILIRDNPGLRIVGTFSGSPRVEDEEEICRMIESARPDVLLVAFGAPKQDLWIARTQARLQIPLAIGVGGTFDFIAGIVKRAPRWMQALGLEWLYRLTREPSRWRRMLTLPQFVWTLFTELVAPQRSEPHGK